MASASTIAPSRVVRLAVPAASGLAGAIDIDDAARGIVFTSPAGSGRPDLLLGLDLRAPCRAADHWGRGSDVVAVYEPQDARRLRATAMWRPFPTDDAVAWELVASAQTGLEQSDASLAVACDVAATDVLWALIDDDGGARWQPSPPQGDRSPVAVLARRGSTSVLIAGAPADVRHVVARRTDGRMRVECWLFSTAAEKGVLFRGRVLAAIGPSTDDAAWAERLRARHAAAPPVLTT